MSKQFVIQLSHTPGALAALCRELEKRAVDLKAIGGGGVGKHGHVILKTADDAATREVLKAGNYEFIEGDSVLAEVDDKPGGMLSVLERLSTLVSMSTATSSPAAGVIAPPSHSLWTTPQRRARHSNRSSVALSVAMRDR